MIAALVAMAAAVGSSQVQGPSPLPPDHRQALQDLLFVAGLSERDLRVFSPPKTGSPALLSAHRDPVSFAAELPARMLRLSSATGFSPIGAVREQLMANPERPTPALSPATIELPSELPSALQEPIRRLIRAQVSANEQISLALRDLTSEERRTLIEGLPRRTVPGDLLPLGFVRSPMADGAVLDSLQSKIDLARIVAAADWLHDEAVRAAGAIRAAAARDFVGKLKFSAGGLRVVVAGHGPDLHDDFDAVLTIDLGGDDVYRGRHGAGIGYASIAIDLGGDDTYRVPDASLGAGLLGVGLAYDFGGEDIVRGQSLSLGSGVGGVGLFWAGVDADAPRPGRSTYRSAAMAQGYGQFGVGVFVVAGPSVEAEALYLSQGAGLEQGIGWMAGNADSLDLEVIGLGPSLLGDSIFRSRSQGFGGRSRPGDDSPAGVGLITLKAQEGVALRAGAESQGCGLDEGVGVAAIDSPGHYSIGSGSSQGFGARRGVGVAWSRTGDDQFLLGQGGGQGTGTESGIGILIDDEGDDVYLMAAGAAGTGLDDGLGLCLDFGGADRFYDGRAAARSGGLERGIGLRLDYTGSASESAPMPGPRYEVDRLSQLVGQVEGRQEVSFPADLELGAALPPSTPAQVETAVRHAAGLDPFAGRRARAQAFRDLSAAPEAVLNWALGVPRRLEDREVQVIGEALRSAPSDIRRKCAESIASGDEKSALRALRISAAGAFPEAAGPARSALERDELAAAAAYVLAELKVPEAIGDLMARAATSDPEIKRACVHALAIFGGPEISATAQALLGDIDPWIRRAAAAAVGRLRPESLETMKAVLRSGDEVSIRGVIAALGAIGSPEALMAIGPMLEDRRPGVRIQALLAMRGRVPAAFRTAVDSLRNDPDARVKAVALWLDPGPRG